jgi:hypothetical protein
MVMPAGIELPGIFQTEPPSSTPPAPVHTGLEDRGDSIESSQIDTSVIGGTEEQRALLAWALKQYEKAGLDLPTLQFHLAGDEVECGGNTGLFVLGSTPWRIILCSGERLVFLHEIGHAWAEYTLTESERVEYVEQRGMESWNDPDTSWRARGSEDAANTLAWGLVDDPIRGMAPDGPLAQKNLAFRLLTGVDSPRIAG